MGTEADGITSDRNMPLVSVVMNCHNAAGFLRQAIDSVYAQSFANWEIVFVDNASTDGSETIAKSYDSRLRYFRLPEKLSLGTARNRALEQCRGEFIAFLDCDDRWAPRKLERQIPLFADPDVGLVFSNCLLFNSAGPIKRRFASREDYSIGYVFFQLLQRYFLPMPTVVVRAAALARLNELFDPALEVCEESDLFLRIARDWRFSMVDEVLAEYRIHIDSASWTNTERFLEETVLIERKLCHAFPDDAEKISLCIRDTKDMHLWSCAISHWTWGRPGLGRGRLLSIHRPQLKHIVFFFVTFVPYGWLKPLLRLLGMSAI